MAEKHPKRPRDLNQWAKRMVDIATGQVEDREQTPEEQGKDPAAVKRGQLGGAKGGKVRAAILTKGRRIEIARKAAKSRWKTLVRSE
jgi:1,2-phenylacetyl-CoA epoxidase PaaB subunit